MRCKIHPNGQDIFVEVDWMMGHRMEETPQNLVIRAFGRHDITLHIDDGCMGGGEIVPHKDVIRFPWAGSTHNTEDRDGDGNPDSPGQLDDFFDFKYGGDDNFNGVIDGTETGSLGYFNHNRFGIFHYVLFTHETESWYDPPGPDPGQWFINAAGWGEQPARGTSDGNDFIITSRASNQASVFMHELGHNLGLFHSQERDGSDRDPTVNPIGSETVQSTCMYWQENDVVNYLSQEWGALELNLVNGGD
ncbi:MAG: hypothetical protein DRN55_01570 [Thermoplasmata archaeon]|nr:MAG: hypothetical protein DRN55_01570 [Thermoplasmata archaeon]